MMTLNKALENIITDTLIAVAETDLDNDNIEGALKKFRNITWDYKSWQKLYEEQLNKTGSYQRTFYEVYGAINSIFTLYIYFSSVLGINYLEYINVDNIGIEYFRLYEFLKAGFIETNGETNLTLIIPQNLKSTISVSLQSDYSASNIKIILTAKEGEQIWKVPIILYTSEDKALDNDSVSIVLPASIEKLPGNIFSGGINIYFKPVNGRTNFKVAKNDKKYFIKYLKPIK